MRATGIVRRIDDLGRVVIPKEIRRTLRIREGDPLEIFTESNGEVIFKKYSPIGELSDFAEQYAEVLGKASKQPVLICDTDHVIAAAGISKKEVLGRRISPMLEECINSRRHYYRSADTNDEFFPVEGTDRKASVVYPIISSGDITGAVLMFSTDEMPYPTEVENKLIQTAAAFLARQTD